MKEIFAFLKNNNGDEHISKIIWVAVAFVAGATLIMVLTSSFQGPIHNWFTNTINSWFAKKNGEFAYGLDDAAGSGFDGPGDSLH